MERRAVRTCARVRTRVHIRINGPFSFNSMTKLKVSLRAVFPVDARNYHLHTILILNFSSHSLYAFVPSLIQLMLRGFQSWLFTRRECCRSIKNCSTSCRCYRGYEISLYARRTWGSFVTAEFDRTAEKLWKVRTRNFLRYVSLHTFTYV